MFDLALKQADPDGVGEGDNFWLWAFEENTPEIMISIICCDICDGLASIKESQHIELCNRLAGGC